MVHRNGSLKKQYLLVTIIIKKRILAFHLETKNENDYDRR